MRLVSVAVVALLLALVGGCSSDESSSGDDSTSEDRVAFVTELMHRDAALLSLFDAGLGKDIPARVSAAVELARTDASTRIETAADLLEEWGEKVPATVRDHGIDHGVEVDVPDLDGAPTQDEIHALADSKSFADDFTELFSAALETTREVAASYDGSDQAAAELAEAAERGSQETLDTMA